MLTTPTPDDCNRVSDFWDILINKYWLKVIRGEERERLLFEFLFEVNFPFCHKRNQN